ncbi:MAG: oligosaccharide flippase family protein [Sphingobium sp.]
MSVRRALVWSYLGQAAVLVLNFGSSVIVSRLLDPSQLGVFLMGSTVAGVLSVLLSFTIGTYLIKENIVDQDMIRTVFTVNVLFSLVIFTILNLIGLVVVFASGRADIATVLSISSLVCLSGVFEFVPAALLAREMRFGEVSVVTVARAAVAAVVVVVLAHAGFGAPSLAFGPLAGSIVSVAIYSVLRGGRLFYRPRMQGFWPVVRFGAQMLSINGVAEIANRLSLLILGGMLGLSALGLYGRAANVSSMIFFNIYGQATKVVFVRLSNEMRAVGSMHATFINAIKLITAVMWPLVMGTAILAGPIVRLVYGDPWLGSAIPLSLLMIAQFVIIGFGLNWEVFVLKGESARQVRFEFLRAVFGTVAFTIGCLFSVVFATLGRVVEACFGYILYRRHMDRLAGTVPGELERVYGESLILTISAVAPALILMMMTGWSAYTSPGLIGCAVGLGVAIWVLALALLKHPVWAEMTIVYRAARQALVRK